MPTSPLPPLYAAWLEQLLAGPIPHERDATCDNCAMCADGREPNTNEIFFSPQTKCCTYVPALPNYLVGRILADEEPAAAAGRATVVARMRAGAGVTPLGLAAPPNFSVLYGHNPAALFGRSLTLRCPHYLEEAGGRCGVWAHRAGVCATWFCKFERGATGMNFWRSLEQLLTGIERNLAHWCLLELGFKGETLRRLLPMPVQTSRNNISAHALDGVADPQEQRALWGEWTGREAEFYRACAQCVGALTWADVLALGGPELQLFAQLTREAYDEISSEQLPAALKVGVFNVLRLGPDSNTISTYSGYDPIELPNKLLEVLPYFDGRPVAQALAAIAAERDVKLDRALVRKLVDFKLLVPCEGTTGTHRAKTGQRPQR